MQPFAYARTDDPAEAARRASADGNTAFIAGGTTLLDLMKLDVQSPSRLVDVNHLPLDKIEETAAGLRIGSMVRNSDLAYHEAVRARYPALSEALLAGATPQIRNMASVGGNLLQRTRCSYFRDPAWPCNKRHPGAGCSALDGYNRSHAILGTSEKCIATHPSDMCVPLAALDAVLRTTSPAGERTIPINDFYISYGDDPARENVLHPGELIIAVELPKVDFFARSRYLKVRDRASFEFALASAAAALDIRDGTIRDARLALGGVATRPWRALEAEKSLVGAKATADSFTAAAKAALKGARPQRFNAFKVELAQRVIVRVLSEIAGTA